MALTKEQSEYLLQCLMGLVVLLSSCILVAGFIMWKTSGYDQTNFLLVLFGAVVLTFMIAGITFSGCVKTQPEPEPPVDTNLEDPPPSYRNTWRAEYLKSGVEGVMEACGTKYAKPKSERRRNVRSIWGAKEEVGVHSSTASRETDVTAVVNESEAFSHNDNDTLSRLPPSLPWQLGGTRSSRFPRRIGRANTVPLELEEFCSDPKNRRSTSFVVREKEVNFDEGLPSYEEAQKF